MENERILPMHARLEKALIAFLFIVVYFGIIYHPDEPVFIGEFNNKDGSIYVVRGVDVLVSLVIFFSVVYRLIPEMLLKKRHLTFLLTAAFILALVSAVEYGLDRIVLESFNLPTGPDEISDKMMEFPQRNIYYSTIIPGNLMVFVLAFLFGLSRDWIYKSRRQSLLLHEKMKADIDFLRSQINPHFFFNAMNNIYAITRRNQDAEAGEAIMKLSGVMRYMIYDSDVEAIGLDKEIANLEQYIDLVRLKFSPDDALDIRFKADGDFRRYRIAPLILLPFVENACKHGLTATGDGYVHIDLRVEKNRFQFRARNPRHEAQESMRKHPGIGLENVKKRLALLYPGRHVLHIDQGQDYFFVELIIDFEESSC